MTIKIKEYLYNSKGKIVAYPETKCPDCGQPWQEGLGYGHKFCCGCQTCGYPMQIQITEKEEAKLKIDFESQFASREDLDFYNK